MLVFHSSTLHLKELTKIREKNNNKKSCIPQSPECIKTSFEQVHRSLKRRRRRERRKRSRGRNTLYQNANKSPTHCYGAHATLLSKRKWEGTNEKGRPPGNRRSMQSYILTYRDFEESPLISLSTIIIIIIYPLIMRVVGAPQMILQPVSSIVPCSPLPS